MKKLVSLILAMAMLFAIAAPALADNAATRTFTDSTGRTVTVPQEITSIAVTGPLGQIVVFAIAPDLFAGIPNEWDAVAVPYLDEKYVNLPVLGQLYGGKGDLNLEELLKVSPQVVIDIGEPKDGVAADMDNLTEQTGIPFVHISAYIDSMDVTYTMLGELLGMEAEGKALADFCTKVYTRTLTLMESVEKVNMLYITGEKGLNVLANGSYHSSVIDMMSNNLAVVDNIVSKGTGNEVDMEQILLWNPDVIVFSDQSIYATVKDDPAWQTITAIKNGTYYEVPVGPHNWLGTPPSVQRLLGMMWMGELFYPDAVTYDLYTEVAEYYKLFYHCELTQEQYDALMVNSLAK